MLLGREAERTRLDACLSDARAGRSSALLLVGGPGLGKTALLDEAAHLAAGSGMRVVRATALEVESGIPAAGLGILLPRLAAGGDGSAVTALLDAVTAAAEAGPLLLVVDDVQWLDDHSWLALAFAVRRLVADPVAVVLASRPDDARLEELRDVPRLDVPPLTPQASRDLLRAAFPSIPADTADRVAAALGHVPLPLVEAGHLLDEDVLAGRAPLPSPAPVSVAVQARYARGFTTMGEETRLALVLLAADDTDDPTVVHDALGRLGLDDGAWDAAERAGLVRRTPAPRFVHPLVRASVHSAAEPAGRRRAHEALGAVLRGRGDVPRALLHLAAAATGPDETLARELAALAVGRSTTPGGRAEATVLALRAADLTTVGEDRLRLLLLAAECSGGPSAVRLGERVAATATDPDLLARATFVRLDQDLRLDRQERVRLTERLDGLELSPGVARQHRSWSVWAAMEAADTHRLELLAVRGDADVERSWLVDAALGLAFTFLGRSDRAVPVLERALAASEQVEPETLPPDAVLTWAIVPGWLGADAVHARRIRRMEAVLRATRQPDYVANAAFFAAERVRREGDWARAEALLLESVELAAAIAAPWGIGLARLASLLACQGETVRCTEILLRAERELAGPASEWERGWVDAARGVLALGQGRPDEAVVALQPLRAVPFLGRGAWDAVATGLVDLVEAHAALGDLGSAQEVADELERWLRGCVDPFGLAMVARTRALAWPDEADARYAEALEHLARTTEVFQVARTRLLLGEHLRRTRRPREARAPLSSAVAAFDRLRARPWAERGRRELAAAGQRPTSPDVATVDLTPQELRTALAVADGLTNAEVAAALFLSVKTIEYHLGNVYRKLQVRSRGGVATALAASGLLPGAADAASAVAAP